MRNSVLTTVPNEQYTVGARIVAFITAFIMLMVNLNKFSGADGEAIIDFLNDEGTVDAINALGVMIIVWLPAVQGWRSKDVELPPGTTTKDVVVKNEAVASVPRAAKMELGVAPSSGLTVEDRTNRHL